MTDQDHRAGTIPQRPLGRTGIQVSALGLGGHHLGDLQTVEEAIRLVHEAVDAGITFFDNCWEYWNGRAEDWLGRALKGRRDKVFLMTKVCTHGRGAGLALKMLDESLLRLQTDHLDLWQVHGVCFDNDPELAYAKGGVLEALDQAKRQGKVRFVGFTGHKDPAIHLDMIRRGYPFDAVQMPLNCLDATFRSFEKQVLPELNKRGIAALGMKPMGGTATAVKSGLVQAEEMLRYAMSLPVATTIAGTDSFNVLRQNLRVARVHADDRRRHAGPARPLRRGGRRWPARILQTVPSVRQPAGPIGARLPAGRHPEGGPGDVVQGGRRPVAAAVGGSTRPARQEEPS